MTQPPVFEHLRRIPLAQPGTSVQDLARERRELVMLAGNGNPQAPAAAVRARVLQAAGEPGSVGSYPDPGGQSLRAAIAARHHLRPGQVLLGNGSSELIELAARALLLDGGSGLAARHSFSRYGFAIQAAGGRFIQCHATASEVEADILLAAVQPDTRIVFLGHPDNPTGTLLDRDALVHVVRALRQDILLVVDQAYAEYVDPDAYPDAAGHLDQRANLLVLHTFSKIHGLAGLRIGYGIANQELIGLLEGLRSPFNTNHLAQVAAEAAIADAPFEASSRLENLAARAGFLAQAGRHRCRVTGQAGNFMLMETMLPAQVLYRELLSRGVRVRPMDDHGLPNHVRVAMGTGPALAAFWKAASAILGPECGCP